LRGDRAVVAVSPERVQLGSGVKAWLRDPWKASSKTSGSMKIDFFVESEFGYCDSVVKKGLVDGLSGLLAPGEAVFGSLQRHHSNAMVGGISAGRAADDHDVACFQRLARNAGVVQLPGAAPFDVVDRDAPVLLFHVHMYERMRIAEDELNDFAFDGLRLRLEIRRGEGVMREPRGWQTSPRRPRAA